MLTERGEWQDRPNCRDSYGVHGKVSKRPRRGCCTEKRTMRWVAGLVQAPCDPAKAIAREADVRVETRAEGKEHEQSHKAEVEGWRLRAPSRSNGSMTEKMCW